MKVNLGQPVTIVGEGNWHSWSKTYETDMQPVVGTDVDDPIWESGDTYKITEISFDFYNNTCYVGLERYKYEITKERAEEMAHMANLHGWEATFK